MRTTWILLAVAVVAAAYFFAVEQPRHHRETRRAEASDDLTDVQGNDVERLVVERQDVTLDFRRAGDGWHVARPVIDRGDAASINTLLQTVLRAEIDRTLSPSAGNMDQYGLAEPMAAITLYDKEGAELLHLSVGNFNLTKAQCYAQLAGMESVLLLPAGVLRYSTRPLFDYRDKKVFDFTAADVEGLTIASTSDTMRWHRRSDGWTTVVKGDTIPGDAKALDGILSELRGLRATRVVADGDDGASPPREIAGSITLSMASDSMPVQYRFSLPDTGATAIAVTGIARLVTAKAGVLHIFNNKLPDLRDRHLLRFDWLAIDRVTLDGPDVLSTIVRRDEEWTYLNPDMGVIDQAEVSKLLFVLRDLRYKEITRERLTDPAAVGLDKPAYRLALYQNDQLVDELMTGRSRPEHAEEYVTSHTTGHLGIIDTESLNDIVRRFEGFTVQ